MIKRLSEIFHKSTITCCWVPSELNVSDYLTKIQNNPVAVVNSDNYRYATESMPHMRSILEKNTFLNVEKKGEVIYSNLLEKGRQLYTGRNESADVKEKSPSVQAMNIGNPLEVWCDECQGNQSECVDAESKFKEVNGRKAVKHIVTKKKS